MPTLKHAEWYAKRGFSIFPCYTIDDGQCSCGRSDCTSPGKHPLSQLAPHGVHDATTDLTTITQWWSTFPDSNIGIATGAPSGVIVVDIDGAAGEQSWQNLEARNAVLDDTWMVRTGSGGIHFYLTAVDGVRNSASRFAPGVDIRGDGGYVIAPPSLHKDGKYEWLGDNRPGRIMPAPAQVPEWLLRYLLPGAARQEQARRLPEKIPEGQRNDWMASLAGYMRRKGFSMEAVTAALKIENQSRCSPPLEAREIERIAWSIDRYPAEAVPKYRIGGRKVGW